MTNHAFTGSAEEYIPGTRWRPISTRSRRPQGTAESAGPVLRRGPGPQGLQTGPAFYPDVIPLDKPMLIGYRAYVNRATRRPAYEDVIPDVPSGSDCSEPARRHCGAAPPATVVHQGNGSSAISAVHRCGGRDQIVGQ